MRTSRRLWRSLESGGFRGLRAVWRECLGEDFPAVAPFLRGTDEVVSFAYPCPYPSGEGCPRGLYRRPDGRIEAVCRSESLTTCDTVFVTKADLVVEEFDGVRFVAHLGVLLGLCGESAAAIEGLRATYLLGVDRTGAREIALYVTFDGGDGRLAETVERLLARDPRPLVVVTAESSLPVPTAEFLRAKGGRTLRLVDLTLLDDGGALVAAPSARAALAMHGGDGASAVHDVGPEAVETPYCRLITNAGPASMTRAQYDGLLTEAESRFALFLDGVAGSACRRDLRGRVHRAALRPKEVAILRELIEARRPMRPRATRVGARCGSDQAAFKLFTDARAKVDVRLGAKRYRAFRLHQVPAEPTQNAYEFDPPADLAYGMVLPI